MFYSEDIIEQVRTENDIVDVIGDYEIGRAHV